MALCLLDEKIRSRLRSGVAISSLAQCVGELVENSIDSGAKCIAVRIDTSIYRIQIIDNGIGVTRTSLELIGQRYATSKCHTLADLDHNLQHLGYRGEALASVISCSGTVEINTRHNLSQQTYTKLFYRGKSMSVTLSSNPRASVGTTITVNDFFYNLPVRRKSVSRILELENVRLALQSLALVNPSVSFTLRNDCMGECMLQTRKTNSVLASFSCLFGAIKASGMKEVYLDHSPFEIKGYLSVESHRNKLLQFVYVNGRVVKKTALHSCVNSMMANSLVVRNMPRQANSKWQNQEKLSEVMSPKRTTERHAVYVLMIKCSRSEYDVCLEPAKTLIEFKDWDGILEGLARIVETFLIQHNLTLGPGCIECEGTEIPSSKESHLEEPASIDDDKEQYSSQSSPCFRQNMTVPSDEETDDNSDSDMDVMSKGSESTCSNEKRTIYHNAEKCERLALLSSSPHHHESLPPKLLHQNRPTRSPFLSHGVSSKLADLLHKENTDKTSTGLDSKHQGLKPTTLPPNLITGGDNVRRRYKPLQPSLSPLRDATSFIPQSVSIHDEQSRECITAASHLDVNTLIRATRCPGMDYDKSNTIIPPNDDEDFDDDVANGDDDVAYVNCDVAYVDDAYVNGDVSYVDDGVAYVDDGVADDGAYIASVAYSDVDDNIDDDIQSLRPDSFTSHYTNDTFIHNVSGAQLNDVDEDIGTGAARDVVLHHMTSGGGSNSTDEVKISQYNLLECPSPNPGLDLHSGSDTLWKEAFDPHTAQRIYIHSKTGNVCSTRHDTIATEVGSCGSGMGTGSYSTSYGSKPPLAAPHISHNFDGFLPGTKRLRIAPLPRPVAQLRVDADDDLGVRSGSDGGVTSKWRNKDENRNLSEGSFEKLLNNWSNPSFLAGQEDIVSMGARHRCQVKVHNIINHYKFTKEMLSNIEVLGQVDKKFIACVLDTKGSGEHDLLVLFDQHATHERVRLENLLDDLHEASSDSDPCPIKSSMVHPPWLINLTPSEKRLTRLFRKQIEQLGVSLKHETDGSISLTSLPSCLMNREASEVRRGRPAVALELVQDMIVKHLEVLHATAGGTTMIPTALTNVLNSQACHSAIKFGDPLTLSECTELIHSLSKCKLPFQCAHGRPSIAPILDLDILRGKCSLQDEPTNLCKKLSSKLYSS